jgi:RNA-binding protein YlmH
MIMSIYQHFRPEEREFIDQVINWRDYVEQSYASKLTDFLDPREQQIVKMIIGHQSDIKCSFFGGKDNTERKRAYLYPDYLQFDIDDAQISLFEVEYAKKFITIAHPQVLGSLMGLGLKRAKFGDILVKDDRIQFFCAKEISDYIRLELHSIGKASVELSEKPLQQALVIEETWSEQVITVSSLRLDTVISSIYQLSRQKSQLFITQGLVKVNWTSIENTSFDCGDGDTISVRGHGRAKINSIEGKTKKDKWRILVGRQK